jgi:GH15 family glucan-1,4-alpha-glucosidase
MTALDAADMTTGTAERPRPADANYPEIGDYALIGDCRTAALISRAGSIDWLCLPHFSGRSVFAALLDARRGGRFSIRPAVPFTVRRGYLGDSNVLETIFRTDDGELRLIDGMPVPTDDAVPAGGQPQRELLRLLRVTRGSVPVEIAYEPRPDYARRRVALQDRGRLGLACQFGAELLHLHGSLALEYGGDSAYLRRELRAGETHCFSLTYVRSDVGVMPPLGEHAERRLRAAVDWWRDWAAGCRYDGPYRGPVMRSLLLLKSLTYALSGAVVAAPTTSLPERMGEDLNWDYRYCWIRDASMTLRAFYDLGYRTEGAGFLGWLLNATHLTRPELQVLYDLYGETHLPERELKHLEGYRHSRPVRIGNHAATQTQLDIYGELVVAAYDYVRRGGELDYYERRMLRGFGRIVCRRWREPDQGIWEERGPPRHRTVSKAMCWTALDRLLKLADRGLFDLPSAACRAAMDAIRRDIETHGYDRRLDSYVAVYGRPEVDASLLLLARYGYCAAGSPRMLATWRRIERDLNRDGLLLRTPPGDGRPREGAFGICSFWAVDYLARHGDRVEATRRFERLLGYANDVGLYGEELDLARGTPLGNFPQAYTHVGLITAALALQGPAGPANGAAA